MAVRWPLSTSLLALVLICACDSSSAPPDAVPTLQLLGAPGDAVGRGGNGSGGFIGMGFTASGSARAFYWSSLTAEPSELPGRGGYTSVAAINRHGVAIGADHATDQADLSPVAVRWVNGVREPLGTPDGWAGSSAVDLNDQGTIVGYVLNFVIEAPFIWTARDGFRLLDLPGASDRGAATDISECGAVVGTLSDGSSNARAVVWDTPGAPARALQALEGGGKSGANAINCDGEVAGYSSDEADPDNVRAVKWQANGVPIALVHPAGLDVAFSQADDIDERGNVVGTLFLRGGPGAESVQRRPVLWPAAGGVIDLSALAADFVSGYPAAILPDGTIVGTVIDGAGAHAAVWLDVLSR